MTIEEFLVDDARRTVTGDRRGRAHHGGRPRGRLAAGAASRRGQVDRVLLFDCRGALQVDEGNTAVVVVHGLSHLAWTAEPAPRGRMNRAVELWTPASRSEAFTLTAALWRAGTLELRGRAAEFFLGDVPGCDDPPPNFVVDDEATVRAGLASWSSPFHPSSASFAGSGDEPDE